MYIVSATEKVKAIASEMETKSLFFMLSIHNKKDDLFYYIVDLFNDISVGTEKMDYICDIQSKGAKNNSIPDIGRELVTLYKNYISKFHFNELILFIAYVPDSFRIDNSMTEFDISNVNPKAIPKLKEALRSEAIKKSYISDNQITDDNIEKFLVNVKFVVDYLGKSDYLLKYIDGKLSKIPRKEILENIFDEVRDMQTAKKNNPSIEGLMLKNIKEGLNYNREISSEFLKMFIVQRIINNTIETNAIPYSFLPSLSGIDVELVREICDSCQQKICRLLFHKSDKNLFWILFNHLYLTMFENFDLTIDEIFNICDKSILNNNYIMDDLSIKYFISLLKDGVLIENKKSCSR